MYFESSIEKGDNTWVLVDNTCVPVGIQQSVEGDTTLVMVVAAVARVQIDVATAVVVWPPPAGRAWH